MNVKSVYNFVPAPKESEVFKPGWADKVSHDIPFEDGESGEIELTLTAKTPIFIRNGHSKQDAENNTKRYQEFSNVVRNGKKEYFIPGSSLKGMFRNVLEIMSFSRMKQISDDRYSFRDLTRNSLYMKSYKSSEVKAGWLTQDSNGDWMIEECEELAFIHHKELKNKKIPFRDLFLNKQPKEKTAEYKYKLVDDSKMKAIFSTYTKELFGNVTRKMAKYDDKGKEGVLVFTGQSSKRKEYTDRQGKQKASGKIHEFVFFKAEKPNYLTVSEKMQKDFKFIYLDHDKQNISKDWRFWRGKLENGKKVPVFFIKKSDGTVKHFGLSFMYKLPFDQSIHETLPIKDYTNKGKDLSEVIFGDTTKDNALKGRVFISHAFSENAEQGDKKREILAGPKASYFPFYVDQIGKKKEYKTYMDKDSELRGFKRYPIQNASNSGDYDEKQNKNDKVFSAFYPLKEGAVFSSKIRFNNLRKSEIGALLSAISFHGNEKKSYHSLGSAKPFGYGQLSVSDIKVSKEMRFSFNEYLSEFEQMMGGEWLGSKQLIELITISQQSDVSLEYPDNPKTFVEYKNEGYTLKNYSEIVEKPSVLLSISKKIKIESDLENFDFAKNKLVDLKKQIKEIGFNEIPDSLRLKLKESITAIYTNHKDSRNKLKKPFDKAYEWHTTISNWVGRETAIDWYNKLNKNQ